MFWTGLWTGLLRVLSAPQASSEKSEHFPVQIAVGKTEHLNVQNVQNVNAELRKWKKKKGRKWNM